MVKETMVDGELKYLNGTEKIHMKKEKNMTSHTVQISLTAKDTSARLTEQPGVAFEVIRPEMHTITIDSRKRFQKMEGFGGAFTEAAAVTLQKLSPEKQAEVMKAYFDLNTGLGYSMGRTHINSCDFALGNYAEMKWTAILSSNTSPLSTTAPPSCRW